MLANLLNLPEPCSVRPWDSAGVFAAIAPARRTSRLHVLEAIASE